MAQDDDLYINKYLAAALTAPHSHHRHGTVTAQLNRCRRLCTLAGVVVEPADLGTLVERQDGVVRECAVAHA